MWKMDEFHLKSLQFVRDLLHVSEDHKDGDVGKPLTREREREREGRLVLHWVSIKVRVKAQLHQAKQSLFVSVK